MISVYYSGQARSRRVFWAAEELGVAYETKLVTIPTAVHNPEYLEIHPGGNLPTMLDGDVQMVESMAICQYLDARYGGGRLSVASDSRYFPDFLQFIHFGEAGLSQPMGIVIRYERREPEERRLPQAVEDARLQFRARIKIVERALADGRRHLAGDFSLADISVGWALSLADRVGERDLPANVAAYVERLKARPAYQRAHAFE